MGRDFGNGVSHGPVGGVARVVVHVVLSRGVG